MKFVNDTKKKIFILTNGCPENRIDSSRAENFFKENNWPIAQSKEEADIILFNACGQYCSKSIPIVKELQKKYSAELIVFGCLTKTYKRELEKIYKGPTFGSDELEKLDELFPSQKDSSTITGNFLIPHTGLSFTGRFIELNLYKNPTELLRTITRKLSAKKYAALNKKINIFGDDVFNIKISTGCSMKCSYCSIRNARGQLKSKSVDDILHEFKIGLSNGYKKIGLIGTEIANYGTDIGTNLPYLLREIIKFDGNYKIKLRNLNPYYFLRYLTEFIEIFKTGKISYLETAAQSGNNRILKLMQRGYTVEEYKKAIQCFKKETREIKIRTQVMVNFPTETEKEAQDTLDMLEELNFDFIELYDFRAEPNTKASRMEQIPQKIARRRYHKMYMKILKLL